MRILKVTIIVRDFKIILKVILLCRKKLKFSRNQLSPGWRTFTTIEQDNQSYLLTGPYKAIRTASYSNRAAS